MLIKAFTLLRTPLLALAALIALLTFLRPALGLVGIDPLKNPEDAQTVQTVQHVRTALLIALILAITWVIFRIVDVAHEAIVSRFRVDVRDNLKARKVHTQMRVLTRTVDTIVFILAVASVLMLFEPIRQLGAALLASAGIAGLVVGLAVQPIVANILAGVQIALTQPINLDDVVIVEGEWGWIEQIHGTYVVVKIWDQRRLVVPLRYFIENPFQNWTKQSSELLGTVFLHTDYLTPIDDLRAELKRLLEASELWDGRVGIIQVTAVTPATLELRVLVSAEDSPKLWDLRCHLRESLIRFLQREHPEGLPRHRASIRDDDPAQLDRQQQIHQRAIQSEHSEMQGIARDDILPNKPSELVDQGSPNDHQADPPTGPTTPSPA